jgi:hypothetical protein
MERDPETGCTEAEMNDDAWNQKMMEEELAWKQHMRWLEAQAEMEAARGE